MTLSFHTVLFTQLRFHPFLQGDRRGRTPLKTKGIDPPALDSRTGQGPSPQAPTLGDSPWPEPH